MESQFAQLRTMVFTIAGTMTIMFTSTCQTFSLSARSKRRRAGRKKAGELAPKLEAAKPHQDGQLSKQPTRTLGATVTSTIPRTRLLGNSQAESPTLSWQVSSLQSYPTGLITQSGTLTRLIPRLDISNAGTDEDQVGA
ncbi:hypothetical protein H4Q26_017177 [Puccinia striiformis f. sp. tritici PST-130]|nr:hypothetical protein H4Q26_017177 [Puccinia striiformis f. sp. tritici PST-130]